MMFSVGFSRPKKSNIFSNLIMRVLGTNYSHTYLVFSITSTGQTIMYHANRKGVHCLEYEQFKEHNVIVDEIAIPTANRAEALRYCISQLGRPYSIMSILSIMLNIKYGDSTKRFICSELVARALGLDVKNLDLATPKEIRKYLHLPPTHIKVVTEVTTI